MSEPVRRMGMWKGPSGLLHARKTCSGTNQFRTERIWLVSAEDYDNSPRCKCCPKSFKPGWRWPA